MFLTSIKIRQIEATYIAEKTNFPDFSRIYINQVSFK